VLREVAQRLGACVRKADTLARAGADEFVVVVCDLREGADCRLVADKILQALAPEFRIGSRRLRLAASIGISLYPADAGDGEALLRNADAAVLRARQLGRNQVRVFGR
jgi:diguanylate cyclase